MTTATLTAEWTEIKDEEARKQAEFDKITRVLCDMDREIEDAEWDLITEFGHGAPDGSQPVGYAMAYWSRKYHIARLREEVAKLEALLEQC